jgi:hypothetical protein
MPLLLWLPFIILSGMFAPPKAGAVPVRAEFPTSD